MAQSNLRRITLTFVLTVALLAVTAWMPVQQTPDWCVAQPDGSPSGCAEITLLPAGILGDFYEGETLLAAQQNPGRLALAPGSHTIAIRNITSTEVGFGTLFTYQDASTTVNLTAGQVRAVSVTARKTYIRGTLDLTCDIRNYAGENVACGVTIDGAPPAEGATLTPAQHGTYILDPGSHTVVVTLTGDPAQTILWSPASLTRTVNITASATPTRYTATFNKAGHLIANLDQAGVVGDWYLDGTQIATQAATIDQWVSPSAAHRLEVRSLTDPAAAGVYTWRDASQSVTLRPGETRTVTIRLTRQQLMGYLDLLCDIRNYAGENVSCGVTIDGAPPAADATLIPAQTARYILAPGQHAVVVTLMGDPAQTILWSPASLTTTVTIRASTTPTRYSASFNKAGHLLANLDQAGVVGDWFLDGTQIATQAATIDQWVSPSAAHRLEVRNITDPAAAGIYRWRDASQSVTLRPGEVRTVTVRLTREYLKGFLVIVCNITNAASAPGAFCIPTLDGVVQAQMTSGQSVQFTLDPGVHTVSVILGPTEQYGSTPFNNSPNIRAGQTTTLTANLTAQMPTITIVNQASNPICYVFIAPSSVPGWGSNQLPSGQRIQPGARRDFSFPVGTYNLHAEDCNSNPYDYVLNVNLTGAGYTWTVTNKPIPAGAAARLTFRNISGVAICAIYVMPAGYPQTPTWEWLGIQRTLQDGQSITFNITSGNWDFVAYSCDQAWYWSDYGFSVSGSFTWTLY